MFSSPNFDYVRSYGNKCLWCLVDLDVDQKFCPLFDVSVSVDSAVCGGIWKKKIRRRTLKRLSFGLAVSRN